MADMQPSRHIGRRNDDAERLRIRAAAGAKRAAFFPLRINARFDVFEIEGFVEHRCLLREDRHFVNRSSREAEGRLMRAGQMKRDYRPPRALMTRATSSRTA